jgi:D-amino-acid dehydrogenase
MKAVIIGGGIIGLCSAYYLTKEGWDVVVVDKTDMLDGCSYGNLGMIVPSHFVPLAAPGMISQGIKWIFDHKSPFYIRPSLSWDLISWGLKFIRSAKPQHVEKAAPYLLHLNLFSKELYESLMQEPGFDFALEQKGILMYFKTEKVAEEEIHLADKARAMGLDAVPLNKMEVQELEPETELDILGAVHYRCDAHLYPNKLMLQLLSFLTKSGVELQINNPVKRIITTGKKIKKVITTKGEIEGDVVIMAGGSWLPQLTKMAGIVTPLMPGKGYSFTNDQPQQKLNVPAILCEARVAITPMDGRMRYGGTMEIAPVNNQVNLNRVEGIVQSVPRYFPGFQLQVPKREDIWYGFRPCSPDGLPYLGKSKKFDNLLIAGGHAMMGLSLGPASGRIMADIANGRQPKVAIDAFHPERFSK